MKKLFICLILSFFLFSCSNKEPLYNYTNIDDDNSNISENTENNSSKEKISVHISGEVKRTGVYEMEKGDRVIDLILKAGGFTPDANEDAVNQAEKLKDGQKIYIPKIGETVKLDDVSSKNTLVDINTANKDELMTLPSVGEKTAQSIIDYRENNDFENFEDLLNVPGIGKKRLESFKGLISIGGNVYEWY